MYRFFLAALVALMATPVLAASPAPALPVDKVILSTAGLAHIEHRLTVEGNQDVTVPVRLDQVDDVMKSLVIFDARGKLGGVTLPGKQPLAQAFRDLPFNQSDLADPIMLLNAYQGAAITVTTGSSTIKGQLVRVTAEQQITDKGLVETRYRLSVMTADGLRRLWLDDAQSLQFDDASIKAEIAEALTAVRTNATADSRAMTVALKGEGRREVTLGYVIDAPLWKAAYRLVLPAAGGTKGLLQGWAVVENMTASDWTDVDMTLVSGNPVTFRQPLYQSYYVTRPEIPVEVLGRVMPRVDEGTVGTAASVEELSSQRQRGAMMKSMAAPAPAMAPMMAMDSAMAESAVANEADGYAGGGMGDMAMGANAAASAEATTQVLFHFPDRLSLSAGQSLLMPFLSQDLEMARLSLYQPDTHPRHPLAAVELVNKGKSGLPPGVLTLYEESDAVKGTAYVGDARLPVMAAGEKRLVSYALDSKTAIDRRQESDSRQGRMTISAGVLRAEQKMIEKTTYTIKAPETEARTVVIEHPRRGDFTLVSPKAEDVEVTDGYYRLRVELKAGEEKKLAVLLERTEWQSYALADLSAEQLTVFAGGEGGLDKDSRAIFKALVDMRRAIDAIDAKINVLQQERNTIFNDQARVRENLQALSGKSDIQERYLKKLNEQESRLADLDKEIETLNRQRAEKLAEMKDRVADIEEKAE